jgi:hypothetical protein
MAGETGRLRHGRRHQRPRVSPPPSGMMKAGEASSFTPRSRLRRRRHRQTVQRTAGASYRRPPLLHQGRVGQRLWTRSSPRDMLDRPRQSHRASSTIPAHHGERSPTSSPVWCAASPSCGSHPPPRTSTRSRGSTRRGSAGVCATLFKTLRKGMGPRASVGRLGRSVKAHADTLRHSSASQGFRRSRVRPRSRTHRKIQVPENSAPDDVGDRADKVHRRRAARVDRGGRISTTAKARDVVRRRRASTSPVYA